MSTPGSSKATEPSTNTSLSTEPSEKIEDIVKELQISDGSYKLEIHIYNFIRAIRPREFFPKLADLNSSTYASASNEELFRAINFCARLLCLAAFYCRRRYGNAVIASHIENKWQRASDDRDSEHALGIIRGRSQDEVREMLARAFFDLETRVEMVKVAGQVDYCDLVSYSQYLPDKGKPWY